jgi:hypothetical protein
MCTQEECEYEGLERTVKGVINALYSFPREISSGLFIGVVRGSITMSEQSS